MKTVLVWWLSKSVRCARSVNLAVYQVGPSSILNTAAGAVDVADNSTLIIRNFGQGNENPIIFFFIIIICQSMVL